MGEIFVSGDSVFKSYLNQEDTDAAFEDGWFKTGDLGYIDEEGNIYITGRLKNLIILDDGKMFPLRSLNSF